MFSFSRLFFSWAGCMIHVSVWPQSPMPALLKECRDRHELPGEAEAD